MSLDYFPSKLALGGQFCNREIEKAFLKENIAQCRHTTLVAPRRYGKSSLVIKVAEELQEHRAYVDLFLAHDDAAVTKRILLGISQAISQIMPPDQKWLKKLQAIFSKFRVSLGAYGFNLEVAIENGSFDPVDRILMGLQGLEKLALSQKKRIIFFIDEFQDISEARSSKSIQGAIRHVAQETTTITFIFSGSNRRLLLELFDDKSKPLYMLCDMMHLERMSSENYHPHLQKLAKKKWGIALEKAIFEKIMQLTELHPYYVNLLCHEIWKREKLPQFDDLLNDWETCYIKHKDRLVSDLEKLTSKQQDVLKALAVHPALEPTGQDFVRAAKTPASSINQTIKSLMDKDMVYKIQKIDESFPQLELNQIRVLDPLLAYALRKYA